MSLRDELISETGRIFRGQWSTRDGLVVPETDDLQLGNDGVNLDATVLYADMAGSTALVDAQPPQFAAEVYKAYLYCAAKVIRDEGGEITAYDGDRIMAVFLGDYKNTSATRAALKINYCVRNIINPGMNEVYRSNTFSLRQTVGIDTSTLLVARTGVRGANDLVWVGRAANHAAKLTDLDASFPSRVTAAVYGRLADEAKYSNGTSMWEEMRWTAMGGATIYRSAYTWAF